jgi:hypothetical protein
MLDVLNRGISDELTSYTDKLLSTYRKLFLTCGNLVKRSQTNGTLYEDRLEAKGQIFRYYPSDTSIPLPDGSVIKLTDLQHYRIIANDNEFSLDWEKLLSELQEWASRDDCVLSAPSQGDPTEVNIADPLAWFDYETAGLNAILGEFACFLWYVYAQGGYLVPLYNAAAVYEHPKTYQLLHYNLPDLRRFTHDAANKIIRFDIIYKPTPARTYMLERYFSEVILPTAAEFRMLDQIGETIRPYLILRLIGTFNISLFDPVDAVFVLERLGRCAIVPFDMRNYFQLRH